MRWPGRTRNRPAPGGAGPGPGGTGPEPATHRSLGLAALVDGLRGHSRVLDLGPAVPANLSFYRTFADLVCFADLLRAATGERAGADAPPLGADDVAAVLPELAAYDAVVAWNALDHLDRPATRLLVDRLLACSRPGTRLYALVSASRTMPALPPRFEIADRDHVLYHPRSAAVRPSPMLTPAEVEKRLAPFRTERAYVLGHGVREMVAILPEAAPSPG